MAVVSRLNDRKLKMAEPIVFDRELYNYLGSEVYCRLRAEAPTRYQDFCCDNHIRFTDIEAVLIEYNLTPEQVKATLTIDYLNQLENYGDHPPRQPLGESQFRRDLRPFHGSFPSDYRRGVVDDNPTVSGWWWILVTLIVVLIVVYIMIIVHEPLYARRLLCPMTYPPEILSLLQLCCD